MGPQLHHRLHVLVAFACVGIATLQTGRPLEAAPIPSALRVSITSPAVRTPVTGRALLEVRANSPATYRLFVDGRLIATRRRSSATARFIIRTKLLRNGLHSTRVVARTGGESASITRRITTANAPLSLAAPAITGGPIPGETLHATMGRWMNLIAARARWLRCDAAGVRCRRIMGATGRHYAIRVGDEGARLRVRITATNQEGATVTASLPTERVWKLPAVGISAGSQLQTWTPQLRARQLDDFTRLHARWIRHDFPWDEIEPSPGKYDWAPFDALVAAARNHHLQVLATLTYTPAWANGSHQDHTYRPASDTQFAAYAAAVAHRYSRMGIHAYEIWNEPNIGFWSPIPNPGAYTKLLCASYRAIHAADRQAVVVSGGLSPAGDGPTTYAPQTFLRDVYAVGGRPCFDAVGFHPYVDDDGANWAVMAGYTTNLRQIMTMNGDQAKKIWATEVGCRYSLGSSVVARRLSAAFAAWHSYPWAGVLTWFTYWDPNEYGLVDGRWSRRPAWYAYKEAAAAFH